MTRTLLHHIEWMPDGTHGAEFYSLPARRTFAYSEASLLQNQKSEHGEKPRSDDWLERNIRFGSPQGRNVEPVWIKLIYLNSDLQSANTTLGCGENIVERIAAAPYLKPAAEPERVKQKS